MIPNFSPNQPPLLALEQVIVGRMRGRLGRGGEEGEQRGELRRGEGSSGAQLCIAQMVFFLHSCVVGKFHSCIIVCRTHTIVRCMVAFAQ